MAEAIISSVVRKLSEVAETEIASLLSLRKELIILSSEFSAIKNVLQDAETRQIGEESVRGWLQKLKHVAYDLDDLLEEWIICFGDQQVRNSSSSNLTSLIKHPLGHVKYRKRVDEIKSSLEKIAKEKERYQFSDDSRVRTMRELRRTDSWVDKTSVIGRDEDKKALVSKLISEDGSVICGSESDKIPTIFILGMGGLGKTTLAKSVFNDERVKDKFGDNRMWVCVGEVFDGEFIMKSMIESWGESVKPSLREQLAEMLKDKLYLLILDDVWNENYEKWKPLLEILNQGAKDSRVVITTRNTGVLAKIRSAYTHELKGLDEDDCLSIFKEEVVEPGKEEEYKPLMNIGKQIVGKCGGLPLAVRTIASAVRGRRPTREQWEMVRNSKIWDSTDILPALMLSFTELNPQLKNCFSYCSIFEKDTLLEKDELVRLWVSQDYIVVNDRRREEEEVGEECFEELLARSMFQEPERDDDGTITRCKMHDLVHDLAQRVTKEECRIIGNDDANNNNHALSKLAGARHCVVRKGVSLSAINLAGVKNLRTLIYSCDLVYRQPIDIVFKLLKSVRVLNLRNCSVDRHSLKHLGKLVHLRLLDLSGTGLTHLPSASIGKLKELRYLDLSDTHIETLPKKIVSLQHLQVINLRMCYELGELPDGILAMASLRRLNVEGCRGLKKLPNGIGRRKDVVVILDRSPVVAASRDAGGGSSSSGGGGCRNNIGAIGSQIMVEGIITVIVDNLVKVAATEIALLLGLTKELDNLSSEFSAIKNVLQDAETRQISDESVRSWLQKLKSVAYDLDDLLEEWIICFGDHQVKNSLSSNLTSHIKHPLRHRKYRKIVDEIKRRLEQIAKEKERYQFSYDTRVRRMKEKRETDSLVDQTSVIGRDEDKETLVSKLISEEGSVTCGSISDKVPTIFILGMGGLGKTTLAKSIYNDQRVKEHFGGKCMWVCVGEVFNGEVIMKRMIESWHENKESSRREQLGEMLKDRKYLLILDDVSKVHYLEWEPLKEILNQGAKGSRIVITTRKTRVIANIRSAYTHELKGLDEDECLSIFKEEVVGQGMEEEYEPLMDIGREIVGKCGGLPLAVKTVASAVRGRRPTRDQWEMVRNSKIWDLPQSDEGILPALMLSYTELPPQLKNCFGYCSIFEKDTILKKDELVRLWVSQGYIVVNDGQREEEEVGEECFEELLARFMFQEPERDDDGAITRCKMHDLVHDLAQWVTKEECRIIGNDDANNNNNALSQLAGARHCVVKPEMSTGDINLAGVENLRTLIYSPYGLTPEPIDLELKLLKSVRVLNLKNCSVGRHSLKHLGNLVHLRLLDLSGTGLTQLPAAPIGNLKELRYLDLSYTDIETLQKNIGTLSSLRQLNVKGCYSLVNLPKTIVSLPHLQVINLRNCFRLEELPEGILEMASLRQLNVEGCRGLKKLPNGNGRRKNVVVRLDRFLVEEAGRDEGGGSSRSNIGELAVMNIRAESLHIFNLEAVGSRDVDLTAKLEERTSLRSLHLSWNDTRNGAHNVTHVAADGVLEGLRPPPHLLTLRIQDYPGQTFPSWMGDGGAIFRRLREVKLEYCKNCTQLPPLGQLPSLENLLIAGLDGVKRVGREFFGGSSPTFPCLKYLTLQHMRNWSKWELSSISSEGEEGSAKLPIMPALERLKFIHNPNLETMLPIFTTSLRRLTIDKSSPMLYHRSSLQFLPRPLYETIAIVGVDLWKVVESALICVVIGTTATELPGSLLLHHTALRMLILADLALLRSLPEELTQLTALQQLIIRNCPELSGRCRVGGELWPKIAHIPHIEIDEEDI